MSHIDNVVKTLNNKGIPVRKVNVRNDKLQKWCLISDPKKF